MFGEEPGGLRWKRQDVVGVDQDPGRERELRHRDFDPAGEPVRGERAVDEARHAAEWRDEQMFHRRIARQGQFLLRQRVAFAQDAYEAVLVEARAEEAALLDVLDRDREVDAALVEVLHRHALARDRGFEADTGRLGRQTFDDRRHERELLVVVGGKLEGIGRCQWVPNLRHQDAVVDHAQGLRERRGEHLGAGRRPHAVRCADQEWVVEKRAQAGQCVAHRRLRKPDGARGARDVALAHQGVQSDEEIQVDGM